MKSSKKVAKAALAGVLVLAMGVTTLFTNAGSSYAAGEAKLNKTSCNILTQRTFDFDVTGASKDAEITWESSDEKVASVDADGVVTGIKKGDVTITCKITADGKTQKLKAKVQVCKPAVKVDITSKITELEYKKTYNLRTVLTPGSSNDVITWTSSDPSVAKVDAKGKVTAVDNGTVTITATAGSGRTDSIEITVYGAPEPTKAPDPTPAPGATAAPKPTTAPKPTSKPKPTTAPKQTVILEESFEKELGDWGGRGGSETLTIKTSVASPDGTKYAQVAGRSQNWHGMAINLNKKLELGGVYNVSAWVRQNEADGEVLKVTTEKNGGAGDAPYTNIGTVTTAKGEWTEITGQIVVAEDTTNLLFYFEADNLIDFMVDKVVIKEVSGGSGLIYKPLQVEGDAVNFKTVDMGCYGWTPGNFEKTDSGVKAGFTKQYDGVVFLFPEALTIGDFSKMYIKMSTTDKVGFRLIDEADQEIAFWWNMGTKDMETIELDYNKLGYSASDSMSAAQLAKKAKGLVVMTTNAACDAVIESISLVPAK
ncbi:MAG: carbohydrate binding domain-containing protein [Lachnospiraceae bacterium]|nr:carbohydrate binding domain-containing protein [Lachnospiraceae bacterium]